MSKKYRIAFVFIIEYGDLEQKGLLLSESLRRFFPSEIDCPIFAVRPRKGKEIKQETKEKLMKFHIQYIYEPVNIRWHNLPFANQAYGSAIIEEKIKDEAEVLVYLDADIVCLKYPDKLFLEEDIKVAITPEDMIQKSNAIKYGDQLSKNWDFAYNLNHVDRSKLWSIHTKVDKVEIYPSFNSGMIATRPEIGLFRRWREMFDISVSNGYFAMFPPFSKDKAFFWTDQVFLSSAVVSMFERSEVLILDDSYNFPPILAKEYSKEHGKIKFDEITFFHYHHYFYGTEWLNYFYVNTRSVQWLFNKLPIHKDRKTAKYRTWIDLFKQYILHYYWKIIKIF